MAEDKPNVRTTKIVKTIRKTFNLGNYQSLDITVSSEDEISWSSLEERAKKSDGITSVLLKDFEATRANAFEKFGIKEKNTGTLKDNNPNTGSLNSL